MVRRSFAFACCSALALAAGCADVDTTLLAAEGQALAKHPGACVQEQKNAAGETMLRTTRTWTDALLVREEQQVLPAAASDPWGWWQSYVTEWTHDAAGRILSRRFDDEADGDIDERDDFEFDAAGRKIREGRQTAWGADKTLWSFDAAGNLLREEWYDHLNNSRLDRKTYDAHGRLSVEETLDNSVLTRTTTHEYDVTGRKLSMIQVDAPNTWSTGQRYETTFAYAPAGHLLTTTLRVDYQNDAVWDRIEVTTHDAAGREIELTADDGGDGTLDRHVTWEYDGAGRKVRERETNGDGSLRYNDVLWAYDAEGRLQKTIWYPTQWQTVKRAEIRVNGPHGVTEIIERYGDDIQRRESIGFDDLGNQVSRTVDWDGNSVPDFSETAGFDPMGNLLWTATDSDGNGAVETRIEFGYGCFDQE